MKEFFLLGVIFSLYSGLLHAQDTLTADELFLEARKAAFKRKDFPRAVLLSKQALTISPRYKDIAVFLSRMYIFLEQPDSARRMLNLVLEQDPGNEEAITAYTDLEFWKGNFAIALELCELGLKYHPLSNELLLKKTKILVDLKHYREANLVVQQLIKKDPKNTEARSLAARIKDSNAKNKVGLQYDFIYFDKQFNAPWHLISASYGRQTKRGSVTGTINYANRYSTNGLQLEIDAYPRISSKFYTYVSVAYSSYKTIFPSYRGGFSVYANLPESFEADAGFRYLNFGSDTWIYTGSLGKYLKNYWINMRAYFTPGKQNLSQSYTLTGRYYFGGANDYVSLAIGSGISPDDQSNNLQLKGNSTLQSKKITAGCRYSISNRYVLGINAGITRQEFQANTIGSQVESSLGFQMRF